jgi:hypothetical protein
MRYFFPGRSPMSIDTRLSLKLLWLNLFTLKLYEKIHVIQKKVKFPQIDSRDENRKKSLDMVKDSVHASVGASLLLPCYNLVIFCL